jgi:DNA topoisomerase-1
MSKSYTLLIVESPAKAKTIEKYLKDLGNFKVSASVGHIRDLPKSNKNAIDIENDFLPNYEISQGKKDVISRLKKLSSEADEVYLATDPDREGEAIAWHLKEILELKNPKRVRYYEITKDAIQEAVKSPSKIDDDLRKAQEARRVLDRLVGYDLSGLIWKKVRYGLSAGRVQSPALRILMEKEREIRAFIPETFWTIESELKKEKISFIANCSKELSKKEDVDEILGEAKNYDWVVKDIKETTVKRSPKPPFTTSSIQQTASSRLGFSPSRTMGAAQKLYEDGHITYMRTDSVNISETALKGLVSAITSEFGKEYIEVRKYASKSKNAQEAHEAIRPSNFKTISAGKTDDQKRLYELIRSRTIASQMKDAQTKRSSLITNITSNTIPDFRTKGTRIIEEGWLKADPGARSEDIEIPKVSKGDKLDLILIKDTEKQTQPPNRYTDAGLVRELEKRGIGRPSTYASIIKTIIDRGYVEKEGRTLIPTDTGDVVSSFLEEHFTKYISDDFTAEMENELDEIAEGKREYAKTLRDFYTPFKKDVDSKEDIAKLTTLGDADDKFRCPKCESKMQIKLGKLGKFLSCSEYPDCDGALTLEGVKVGEEEPIGKHPESGESIYILSGRFGPYVQLGKTPEDKKIKPQRASVPKEINTDEITIEDAVKLLSLPRDLGEHPKKGGMIIANVGRFGPYVGHDGKFKSLKKISPYEVTLKEAVKLIDAPKQPPRGAEIVRTIGEHPKTKREITLYKSKSGHFVLKGLKRIYIDDSADPEKVSLEEIVETLKQG